MAHPLFFEEACPAYPQPASRSSGSSTRTANLAAPETWPTDRTTVAWSSGRHCPIPPEAQDGTRYPAIVPLSRSIRATAAMTESRGIQPLAKWEQFFLGGGETLARRLVPEIAAPNDTSPVSGGRVFKRCQRSQDGPSRPKDGNQLLSQHRSQSASQAKPSRSSSIKSLRVKSASARGATQRRKNRVVRLTASKVISSQATMATG